MAEGQKGLSRVVEVNGKPQDELLQAASCVQEEKTHGSQKESKKTQTESKKICEDKSQGNGKRSEIKLPMGYKMTLKRRRDIMLHTNTILEALASNNLDQLLTEIKATPTLLSKGSADFSFHHQLYQNICVNGLKDMLECTHKHLHEGHKNSPWLNLVLFVLERCCMTSAALKRALSFPGMAPLLEDFIDTYLVAFIDTPFLNSDKLRYLARNICMVLNILGKFMAFPTLISNDLRTWWKTISESHLGRAHEILNNAPPLKPENLASINDFHLVSAMIVHISECMERIQASDPPQPYEIVKRLDQNGAFYTVFVLR